MKNIYIEKYTISTDKTRREIISELEDNVNIGDFSDFMNRGEKDFNGYVNSDNFEIRINYHMKKRNYAPTVEGEIIENESGCIVNITLSPQPSFIIVAIIALLTGVFSLIFGMSSVIKQWNVWEAIKNFLFPIPFFISAMLLPRIPNEAKRETKEKLEYIIKY